MRRFMAIPLAGLLALTLAASALAGPNVGNYSSSVTIAQASWDSYDEATDTFSYGYVAVSQERGGAEAFAEYAQGSERHFQCTGEWTPGDPTDDTFGIIGETVWGYGPASLAIGRGMSSASAGGTLQVVRETFNECTGEYSSDELPALAFSLDLAATSATVKESGRGSFHLPGEYNSHSSYKAAYRFAEGDFDAGAGAREVFGQIGTVSWRDHSNG
jgi:hypothetical protein